MTAQAIVNDIQNYILKVRNTYKDWYVGIASDPKKRLFVEHKVSENGHWIHSPADSNEVARQVEEYFLKLGCDGGSGGGDNTSNIVYAYLKTSQTVE